MDRIAVIDSLARLRGKGVIHRLNEFAFMTRAARESYRLTGCVSPTPGAADHDSLIGRARAAIPSRTHRHGSPTRGQDASRVASLQQPVQTRCTPRRALCVRCVIRWPF
jgi:hypothetical protein